MTPQEFAQACAEVRGVWIAILAAAIPSGLACVIMWDNDFLLKMPGAVRFPTIVSAVVAACFAIPRIEHPQSYLYARGPAAADYRAFLERMGAK